MSFPRLAYENFKKRTQDKEVLKLYRNLLGRLKKMLSPLERAIFIHKKIDDSLSSLLKDESISRHIQCKKGCSACCHTQVSVTNDEAKLLVKQVKSKGIEIDLEKLEKQAQASENSLSWYRLSYGDRSCIFLDKSGACTVYENRPSVCRTNYALSDPKFCETIDGKEQRQRLLKTELADIFTVCLFTHSNKSGSLPKMLWDKIKPRKSD